MLARSAARIADLVDDEAVVLDVGGGASPFARADWVIDVMSYDERSAPSRPERFSEQTWITRDACDREPFPFAHDEVDFVVCSHTLEDVRDPLWVCSEMNRIAKAGYIEVPSRLEEQSYGFQGPWAGWAHHRWLIEEHDGALEFVMKSHVIHGRESDHFPAGFRDELSDEERVLCLFWEGGFEYSERIFRGPGKIDRYLAGFVERELHARGYRRPSRRRPRWLRRPSWLRRP